MPELEVETGPAAGQIWPLAEVTTIGRGKGVDFRVDDPALSRLHARFRETTTGEFVVEDLDSHNGTFVNRREIKRETIKDSDLVQVGKTQLIFKQDPRPTKTSDNPKMKLDISGEQSTTLGESIAIAPDRETSDSATSSLSENAQATHKQLRMVIEFFQSIDINMDEDELLARILDILFEAFPHTDRGFIVLRNPETHELTPAAAKDTTSEQSQRMSLSQTLVEQVIDKEQSVLSRDALHDGRFEASQSIRDLRLRSVMCTPLKHEDNILGFISLDTHRVTSTYNKESLAMLAALANFASLAIGNARLHRDLVAQERMDRDLRNAQRIQHSFLPQSPPNVDGYEFSHWYNAAHEVGGDFYDFIRLPDDRLAIIIGDVSGKGITAALLMAKIATDIRSASAAGQPPSALIDDINQSLIASTTDRFITLIYAIIDPRDHVVECINAGHWPPLIRREGGSIMQIKEGGSLPVGISPDATYSTAQFQMESSDRLCLYTDGVIDAMDEAQNPYGIDRLVETIQQANSAPQSILESVQQSVWSYMGNAKQHDDTTFLCCGPV